MNITPEQMALSGTKTTVAGSIASVWSFADTETGEVRKGVKVAWFGASGSVPISDEAVFNELKKYEDLGTFIILEVSLTQKKDGSYRMGNDSKVLELDGKKFNLTK